MKIIIDGDACPSIPIIEKIAKKYNIDVLIYCDFNHYIQSNYSEVKIVDSGFQSVDMHVVNSASKDDIVISQDYGVAAMCLRKKAYVINPKGYIYSEKNIDRLLEERHISQKIRRAGGKAVLAHPVAYEHEDNLSEDEILDIVKDMKADGIETNYIYINRNNETINEIEKWNAFAKKCNLPVTLGSDFHNKDGIRPEIGLINKHVDFSEEYLNEIVKWIEK